jgi:hypothetical protein
MPVARIALFKRAFRPPLGAAAILLFALALPAAFAIDIAHVDVAAPESEPVVAAPATVAACACRA